MTKIKVEQIVTFEEAQKIALLRGFKIVIMVAADENETTIYVA